MVYIDVKESWTQILDIDCGKGINRFKLGLKKKKRKEVEFRLLAAEGQIGLV